MADLLSWHRSDRDGIWRGYHTPRGAPREFVGTISALTEGVPRAWTVGDHGGDAPDTWVAIQEASDCWRRLKEATIENQ